MAAKVKENKNNRIVVAKTDDGTIQITFTIPFTDISKERAHVEEELAKDVQVPGFRKGKAPVSKALQKISESTIIEHTLQHILPTLLAEAIREHTLRPAIYPKFELIKANPDEDWEVKAITAEIPEAKLGDYKATIMSEAKSNAIWTPGKGDEKKEVTSQDKEQLVVKALLDKVEITIPAILIEEETNARLSQLLEKIERLGLNLDSYLASVGKDVNKLREEYEAQSRETLKLDIILNQIAQEEKISVPESDVTAAIQASAGDPALAERLNTPEQRRVVESILRKRSALEKLTSLI